MPGHIRAIECKLCVGNARTKIRAQTTSGIRYSTPQFGVSDKRFGRRIKWKSSIERHRCAVKVNHVHRILLIKRISFLMLGGTFLFVLCVFLSTLQFYGAEFFGVLSCARVICAHVQARKHLWSARGSFGGQVYCFVFDFLLNVLLRICCCLQILFMWRMWLMQSSVEPSEFLWWFYRCRPSN